MLYNYRGPKIAPPTLNGNKFQIVFVPPVDYYPPFELNKFSTATCKYK